MTVPVELMVLAAACVLGLVQLLWAAIAARAQQSLEWSAGPRDVPPAPLTGIAGRLDRAFRNFQETFPIFVAAVLAVVAAGKTGSTLAVWGAGLYLAARIAFVPLYVAGVRRIRSYAWLVALAGLLMVIAALFL